MMFVPPAKQSDGGLSIREYMLNKGDRPSFQKKVGIEVTSLEFRDDCICNLPRNGHTCIRLHVCGCCEDCGCCEEREQG
jgi:hypothetical protein